MKTFETKVKGVMNVLLDIEKQFGTDVPYQWSRILNPSLLVNQANQS